LILNRLQLSSAHFKNPDAGYRFGEHWPIRAVRDREPQEQIVALTPKNRTFAGIVDWEPLPARTRWKAKNAKREIGVPRFGHNVTQ